MKSLSKAAAVLEERTPVMSLAQAMTTMGQVLRGEIDAPEDFPNAKAFFNDEAARQWHTPRGASSPATPPEPVPGAEARVAAVDTIGRRMVIAIANPDQLAAFAKLFVDNGELLRVLAEEGAESTASLARRLEKDPGNVGRSLKKFEAYGVVRFVANGMRARRPVLATEEVDFKVNFKSGQIRLTA